MVCGGGVGGPSAFPLPPPPCQHCLVALVHSSPPLPPSVALAASPHHHPPPPPLSINPSPPSMPPPSHRTRLLISYYDSGLDRKAIPLPKNTGSERHPLLRPPPPSGSGVACRPTSHYQPT